MTTITAPEVLALEAVCPMCQGDGNTRTAVTDPETGLLITETCTSCSGTGAVDVEASQKCAVCTTWFWADEGCHHAGEPRCGECISCIECLDEVREQGSAGVFGGGWG